LFLMTCFKSKRRGHSPSFIQKKIKSIIHHHSPSSFTIHPTISNTCVWTSGHQCLDCFLPGT
jgi:hypothetical protein